MAAQHVSSTRRGSLDSSTRAHLPPDFVGMEVYDSEKSLRQRSSSPESSRSGEETLPRYSLSASSLLSSAGSSECDGPVFDPEEFTLLGSPRRTADHYLGRLACLRYLRAFNPVPLALAILVPSFLRGNGEAGGSRKLMSTAWLDGLRGVAALLVVFHHTSLLLFPWYIHDGYAAADDANHRLAIQLPIARLFISGPPQVCVFFVVSGYALSYRPLTLLSHGRQAQFSANLASSIMRRHSRLFVPASAASLFSAVLVVAGCFGSDQEVIPGTAQPFRSPPNLKTLAPQMSNWAWNMLRLMNPFAWDLNRPVGDPYDPNQWTLPIEFVASIIIFLLLAGTSGLRPFARASVLAVILGWAGWKSYFALVLFVGGMATASLRVQLERRNEKQGDLFASPKKTLAQRYRWPLRALSLLGFILALYILGTPEFERGAPSAWGYQTLVTFTPSGWQGLMRNYFWPVMGSLLIVLVLDHAAWLQAIFTTGLAQYLGKISFSLYLVHGPILYTVARPTAVALSGRLGTAGADGNITTAAQLGGASYALAVLGVVAVTVPILLILADAGARYVDEATVKLLKAVYNRLALG